MDVYFLDIWVCRCYNEMRCGFCGPRNKERQIAKNKLPLVWGSCRLGFREVGSLTKKTVKSLISHGFTALYDGGIDGYSITAGFSFSIFCFFNSIDECTYLFNVIFTLEWPKISLRLLISNPSSTHLVAKVCRSAW